MAIIKSQIKRNRQNEKRRLRNKSTRSEMHTRIKSALAHAAHAHAANVNNNDNIDNADSSDTYSSNAASAASDESKKALIEAIKCIDKAAAQKVIHKNTAARKKSRLYAQIRTH